LYLGRNFYQKFENFAIFFSYLSPYFYTDNIKISLKRTDGHRNVECIKKNSSESLKGPAGIALLSGGDAYWFLVYKLAYSRRIMYDYYYHYCLSAYFCFSKVSNLLYKIICQKCLPVIMRCVSVNRVMVTCNVE